MSKYNTLREGGVQLSENEKSELIAKIRKLAITKSINFLIGSGASKPAIPLMGEINCENDIEKNRILNEKVRVVSKYITTNINRRKKYQVLENIHLTSKNYIQFVETIVHLLNISNSRQTPKSANLFTTNYDLFIENAIDHVSRNKRLVFNDGAKGYMNRHLDSCNYNQLVSYKGLNDNYISEIPSISLIKPHGSVNWMEKENEVIINHSVVSDPVIVLPTGLEGQSTFLNNHFHEMLRVFQLELDKPQSVLFVLGFSFQDQHIAKMVKRALKNPELIIFAFGFSDNDRTMFLQKLKLDSELPNFRIITPSDLEDKFRNEVQSQSSSETWYNFTISNLTTILSMGSEEEHKGDS